MLDDLVEGLTVRGGVSGSVVLFVCHFVADDRTRIIIRPDENGLTDSVTSSAAAAAAETANVSVCETGRVSMRQTQQRRRCHSSRRSRRRRDEWADKTLALPFGRLSIGLSTACGM